MDEKYVCALDVGTTTVRCHIINSKGQFVGSASDKVELLYPEPGHVEIDPDDLWKKVVNVMKSSIKESNLEAAQVTCLAIATQRGTFTTWDKNTGRHFHNFITWKDLRSHSLVQAWNDSFVMKAMRSASHCLYLVTRNKRFLAGSVLRLATTQVNLRLHWALENVPELRYAAEKGTAMFGTVDTWLLHRLTNGRVHVTDASSASATALFDPFTMTWASWAVQLFRIPPTMLPKVVDTAGTPELGAVDEKILGACIPIKCSMADQSASIYGSCCFSEGDLKITLGTGAFLDTITGSRAHASAVGLYPIVGWQVKKELVYVAEGSSNDTGSVVEWALRMGLISDPSESSDVANSVPNSDGVFFIPAFSGLGPPINDYQAATGFLGLKPTTVKQHMVRAILESIVFRVFQLYRVLLNEQSNFSNKIRVDGGVSRNDFICQLLADMTGLPVERPKNSEMSTLGIAYLAGIHAGIWRSTSELQAMREIDRVFEPRLEHRELYLKTFARWCKAVDRFLDWGESVKTSDAISGPGKIFHLKGRHSKQMWKTV